MTIICLLTSKPGVEVLMDADDLTHLGPGLWNTTKAGDGRLYVVRAGEYLHRIVTGCPPWLDVDHINGNGLDNRRENLRMCTHAQNMRNRKTHRHSATGVKGVRRKRSKYAASIRVDGVTTYLGTFTTIEAAAAAYREAAIRLHGAFARTA